ncbi:MAG: xanthine dehydrogenase family protein molybdopterin-binding subunit [Candidatus Lambdaproteobacteria bacterium]|nr:xanthine dehydrogenase family protein molybdopterin-binding subunit [Candidatus Lambdaproteobacteria bacterium]
MTAPADVSALSVVGTPVARRELAEKVTGRTRYTADLHRPGMLHGRVLRSPHPHARIVRVDASAALRLPGVHAVLTPEDAPQQPIDRDLRALEPLVRFAGEEVALVAAESEAQAEDALRAIEVVYEPLPAVLDPEAALAPGAPEVHPGGNLVGGKPLVVQRGDVAAGFAQAARIFEGTFRTQAHAPVAMETRAALAEWEGDRLTLWKTSRAVHASDRPLLARGLGIPAERIRVICTAMGGGFGNKDETRLGVLTALLARKAGRPVRVEYSRREEVLGGRNRQATVNRLRIGVRVDGTPVAIEQRSVMDAGAYISSGINVNRRTGQGALYLYTCPNARYEGHAVYTNRPAGGSFRGLGAPLGHFAVEVLADEIAAALGIDPLDYRLRHHVTAAGQPGTRVTAPDALLPDEPVEGGVPFSSNALRACLLVGAERIGWHRRRPDGAEPGERVRGLGVAMGTYKGGAGREAEAELHIAESGRVALHLGLTDVGQGSATVLAQIAAEALTLPAERIETVMADTARTPPGHVTAGSTTTFSTGEAVRRAALAAAEQLRRRAAEMLGVAAARLEAGRLISEDGRRSLALEEVAAGLGAELVTRWRWNAGSSTHIVNSFAAHFAEVEVDRRNGHIRVLRYVAAQDSGRIVNPRLAAGQVSGAVLQFLGIALREELFLDPRSGVTLNPSFLEHKSTAIVDFPAVEVLFLGEPDPVGPYGAKALGEPPVVPVFAAIANAVANAAGVRLHEVPFTPQRVLAALKAQGRLVP